MTIQTTSQSNLYYPKAISSDIVIQETSSEILIYNLKNHQALCLNETAKLVFNFSNGSNSINNIAGLLQEKTGKSVSEDLIWLTLEGLAKENLLEDSKPVEDKFKNLSRRKMVKQIGLFSVITLPVISSLIAPRAVAAASTSANAGCTSDCLGIGACTCTGLSCPPPLTVDATIRAGLCVNALVAATTLGVTATAGVNGNVCVYANVCISL